MESFHLTTQKCNSTLSSNLDLTFDFQITDQIKKKSTRISKALSEVSRHNNQIKSFLACSHLWRMEKKFFILNVVGKSAFFYWTHDRENVEYLDLRGTEKTRHRKKWDKRNTTYILAWKDWSRFLHGEQKVIYSCLVRGTKISRAGMLAT